jgi:anti-anti-sigma regulatory factor
MTQPAVTPKVTVENGVTVVGLGPGFESVDEHLLDSGVREALLKIGDGANPPRVVLDLSHTTFFGSSFIEILFRLWNRLQERPQGEFAISGLTPYCQEVLKIAHLDTLWRLFPDRASAVRELSAGKP